MDSLRRASRALREHPGAALLVAMGLCVAAYARVLDAPFVFDDLGSVVRNPEAHGFAGQPWRLLAGWLRGGRPLTDLTFAANYAVGGLEPWNFHATSLGVHLGVVLLAWAFLRRILRRAGVRRASGLAVAVAGLFALHPLHAEVVAYVAQRSEALAGGLALAALLCLLEAEERALAGPSVPWLLAGAACFAAALGAKATAITVPAAWVLVVLTLPERGAARPVARWGRRAAALVPLLAIALLFASGLLGAIAGKHDVGFSVPQLPPAAYLVTQLQVIPTYLRLLAWPEGLRIDWDFRAARSPFAPAALAGGALLATLLVGAVIAAARWRHRDGDTAAAWRVGSFGILWTLLQLSVTSSVVPLKDLLAEHRTYLPSLGVLVAAGIAVDLWLGRTRYAASRWFGATATLVVWAAAALALHARNAAWESPTALFADCVEKSPWNARAWLSYGHALSSEGRIDQAVQAYERALPLAAGDGAMTAQITRNLAAVNVGMGRLDDAERLLTAALGAGAQDADLLANLAVVKLHRGDFDAAEPLARRAIALSPGRPEGWNVLGEVELHRERPAEALARFQEALRLDPGPELRRFNVAKALAAMGRVAEACRIWSTVSAANEPSMARQKARSELRFGCGPGR